MPQSTRYPIYVECHDGVTRDAEVTQKRRSTTSVLAICRRMATWAAMLACLLNAVTLTDTADAGVPASAQERFHTAVARFEALARKTQAEGRLPQLSNMDEAPVLKAVWDGTLLGQLPYSAIDLEALETISAEAGKISETYLAGRPLTEEDRDMMRIPPAVLNYAEKYQDELAYAGAFAFEISIHGLSASAEKLTHLEPAAREGMETEVLPLRNEINRKLFLLPHILSNSIMSEASTKTWADMLARNATELADLTPLLGRDVLISDLKSESAKTRAPFLKLKLEVLTAAMSSRHCERLCLVPLGPDQA